MKRHNTVFPGGSVAARSGHGHMITKAPTVGESIAARIPPPTSPEEEVSPSQPGIAIPHPEISYATEKSVRAIRQRQSMKLPLPVNTSQPVEALATQWQYAANVQVTLDSPWQTLKPLSKEKWAMGFAVLGTKDNQMFVVCEKQGEKAKQFKRVVNPNILELFDVYFFGNSLYFVYEYVDVSLEDILTGPERRLTENHAAAVCKGILLGLTYMHDQAGLVHNHISSETIFITWAGIVKLGYIGESQLLESSTNKQDDILALRQVMLHIGAPEEIGGNVAPTHWSPEARSFFDSAASQHAAKLLEEEFIVRFAQDRCLAGPAFYTGRCKFRRWERSDM